MDFSIRSGIRSYHIHLSPGSLACAADFFDLDRRVLVVTDDGVPPEYAQTVVRQCRTPVLCRIPQGESSKSIGTWQRLLSLMLENGFSRADCVVAVGGGVVGDLAGFAASAYMRGIDFYNVPTTSLSQIDSSIGGKTAVNLNGVKNAVGAFYPPRGVLIDTDLLTTLSPRQLAAGLAEAVKMALTNDGELFELIEKQDIRHILPQIIQRSLLIKKAVVEADETETGLRRVLNFGHTIGHGIESTQKGNNLLYHGECVALGMLPLCETATRERLLSVMKKLGLPTVCHGDPEAICGAISHDKKANGDHITLVSVDRPGHAIMKSVPIADLYALVRDFTKGMLG